MAKKTEDLSVLLSALRGERDALEADIEGMIGAMAGASVEERRSGAWASDGELTQRYLAQSSRLAEVEQAIIDLSRQLAAEGKPPS